ncbi:hypothetical protein [Pseudidiomarina taiwanensis]|uniref:Uncharacterized protein n=1 Tax=Pseudidiomarina taiwanensis TaxID=337250 RepID=A0A432ZKI2_9GAMM|nr:hypothetical protein [Pseudidiomarina taiwanensis]RUO78404.1 hypothetical protein CWI83_05080 [Pseudidiomarina taiwanensis]
MNELDLGDPFDVEGYLTSISGSYDAMANIDKSILEALCKKVDVVKKVYAFYSKDLKRKQSDLEISLKYYLILLNVLKTKAWEESDFKYLNSYLKLLDLIKLKGAIGEEEHELLLAQAREAINDWID